MIVRATRNVTMPRICTSIDFVTDVNIARLRRASRLRAVIVSVASVVRLHDSSASFFA